MKIMSINAGSSSLKFSLFDMEKMKVIASGLFERIGIEGSNYSIKFKHKKYEEELEIKNHKKAVSILTEKLTELKIVDSLDEIGGIGHRIVNGKDLFDRSVVVDEEVMEKLESIIELAPLHNGANVAGIKAFQKILPNTPMTVVFDTAFHQTIDDEAYLYPVPYEWYEKFGVRKYGAHGTSHRYITEKVKEYYGENKKIISCHIGSGASLAAIKNGKCIDTSMGFTPLAGIMMGTRSGDIDPSIIPYVMKKEDKKIGEVIDDLNKNSGLLGLSGISSDMRDIIAKKEKGNPRATLTFNKFVRRTIDYIAQYYALLEGVDAIVFTAGIGENSAPVREAICEKLKCFGVKISKKENEKHEPFIKLSTPSSKIDIFVISTDEELMIAKDTYELIK